MLSDCIALEDRRIVYDWSITGDVTWPSVNAPRWILPRSILETGAYNVTVMVSMLALPTLNVSNSIEMTILPAPLLLVVDGPTYRQVAANVAFTLAAVLQDSESSAAPVTYTWRCATIYGAPCTNSSDPLVPFSFPNSPRLRIGAEELDASEYVFTVTATKDTRSASQRVFVLVTPGYLPLVEINCLSGCRTNLSSSSDLVLRGSWVLLTPALGEVRSHFIFDPHPDARVYQDGTTLIVRSYGQPIWTPPSERIYFMVTYTDLNGQLLESMSWIELYINTPPKLGNLTVTPTEGNLLSTIWTFSAPGWEDDDTPLSYRYFVESGGHRFDLLPRTEATEVSVRMPMSGDLNYGVVVYDALGSHKVHHGAGVLTVNDTVPADLEAYFDSMMASSSDDLMQVMAAILSLLGEGEENFRSKLLGELNALRDNGLVDDDLILQNLELLTSSIDVALASAALQICINTTVSEETMAMLYAVVSNVMSFAQNDIGGARRRLLADPSDADVRVAVEALYATLASIQTGLSRHVLTVAGSSESYIGAGFISEVHRFEEALGKELSFLDLTEGMDVNITVPQDLFDNAVVPDGSNVDVRFIFSSPNPFTWGASRPTLFSGSLTVEITDTVGQVLPDVGFDVNTSRAITMLLPAPNCTASCVCAQWMGSEWSTASVTTELAPAGYLQCRAQEMGTFAVLTCPLDNVCVNGAPNAQCSQCECDAEWRGFNCTECGLICLNGGYADASCEACVCPGSLSGTWCTSVCGDSVCSAAEGETAASCYTDCGYCGDGPCTPEGGEDEDSCYVDCGDCGDDICHPLYEDAIWCYQDCGFCGDHICTESYENFTWCEDCSPPFPGLGASLEVTAIRARIILDIRFNSIRDFDAFMGDFEAEILATLLHSQAHVSVVSVKEEKDKVAVYFDLRGYDLDGAIGYYEVLDALIKDGSLFTTYLSQAQSILEYCVGDCRLSNDESGSYGLIIIFAAFLAVLALALYLYYKKRRSDANFKEVEPETGFGDIEMTTPEK